MNTRTYRILFRGAVIAIAAGLFIGAMVVLSTVFHINIPSDLTLLFNEPAEYGEWEVIEEINGVEHVYSSANGDNPKEVLSPFSYWLEFRGGFSVILVIFVAIFAYLIGRAIVSSVLRTKGRAQTIITEARNHTLGDRLSDTVNDYVDQCREEIRENREHPDRSVYIFGRKFEKGDRKSIILLILFILLMVAVVGYFVVMSIL